MLMISKILKGKIVFTGKNPRKYRPYEILFHAVKSFLLSPSLLLKLRFAN